MSAVCFGGEGSFYFFGKKLFTFLSTPLVLIGFPFSLTSAD